MTTRSDRDEETESASLFEHLPSLSDRQVRQARARTASEPSQSPPRLLRPNRRQIELRASDLESLLGEDHRARLVWGYVEQQDLSALLDAVKARGALKAIDSHRGR